MTISGFERESRGSYRGYPEYFHVDLVHLVVVVHVGDEDLDFHDVVKRASSDSRKFDNI